MVLPAPVGPTMATVSPGSAVSVSPSISGAVGVVRERDVLERDAAHYRCRIERARRVGSDLVLVEQLDDAFERREAGLERGARRRELLQRLTELAHVLEHRLDGTERDRAVRDAETADDGDR